MQRLILTLILALGIIPFLGCDILNESFDTDIFDGGVSENYKPKNILTLNLLIKYPRAKDNERQVETVDNKKVWINKYPKLHSRHIEQIKMVPSEMHPGMFDLELKLSKAGRRSWMVIRMNPRFRSLSLCIENNKITKHYLSLDAALLDTDENFWVKLEGPFVKEIALDLVDYSKSNYKFLNRDVEEEEEEKEEE